MNKYQKQAFAKAAKKYAHIEQHSVVEVFAEDFFLAGWAAAENKKTDLELSLLEKIAECAIGLSIGLDWNNGTAANKYRDKLVALTKQLTELRESGEAQA